MVIPGRLCLLVSIIVLCFFGTTQGGTWTFWRVNPSTEVGGRAVAKNQRQHQPDTDKKGSVPQTFLSQELSGGISQTTVSFLKVTEEFVRSLREFVFSSSFDELFYEDDFQKLLKERSELHNIAIDKPEELRENILRGLEDARANIYNNLQKIDATIQGLPLCAREVIEALATGDRKRLKDALEPKGMEGEELDDGIERLREIVLDDKDFSNMLKVDGRILNDPMKWDAWARKSYAKAREFLSFRRY
eukprot:scaffold7068_cov179-Ochromonas_danica.AAC.7